MPFHQRGNDERHRIYALSENNQPVSLTIELTGENGGSLTVTDNAIVDARNGGISASRISDTLPTPTPTGDSSSGIVFDGTESDNTKAGTAKVTVTPKEGSRLLGSAVEKEFTITKAPATLSFAKETVSATINDPNYTGDPASYTLTVREPYVPEPEPEPTYYRVDLRPVEGATVILSADGEQEGARIYRDLNAGVYIVRAGDYATKVRVDKKGRQNPLRTLEEPGNLISGPAACPESPGISFLAPPHVRRARESHFWPRRVSGEPGNPIFGPAAYSESPEISFLAPPRIRRARKSHFWPRRVFGEPGNPIFGPAACLESPEISSTGSKHKNLLLNF